MMRFSGCLGLKIIYPLRHPEMYKAYGKSVGGGILMYGPPGCGKTYLARATAGEIEAGFIAVGISDVLEMWIGNSERNLHQLFEQARDHQPCVLFFDEVDALGGRRSDMHGGAGRQIINQFLAEMDGVGKSNEGVLILAATNAPWHVDPAFRRPGRFDRVLFVPPPDAPARADILRLHCRGKPAEAIDFDHLGQKTAGFSGANLKAVADLALEGKPLLLRLNRFGRLALSREQIVTSNWVGLCVAGALVSLVLYFTVHADGALVSALVCGLLIPPLATIYQCDPGWPRTTTVAIAIVQAAVGLSSAALVWSSQFLAGDGIVPK